MMYSIGKERFDAKNIAPPTTENNFDEGFGLSLTSLADQCDFNALWADNRHQIRALIEKWGVVVMDHVDVHSISDWQQMIIDQEFLDLPWHSDGSYGNDSVLLTCIKATQLRNVPTLVAPSVQLQKAINKVVTERTYPQLNSLTQDALFRASELPLGAVNFFESLFLTYQHTYSQDRYALRAVFSDAQAEIAPFIYTHQWRPRSVLMFDTKHYEQEKITNGFTRVVHARLPLAGQRMHGAQPYRLLA